MAGQVDLKALLPSAVGFAMEITGAPYGAIGVLGDHGGLIDFIYRGVSPDQAERIGRFPEGLGLLGTVITDDKTVRLDTIADHPRSVSPTITRP